MECCQLLIDWGADPDHTDNDGKSAWLAACREGHCKMLRWLATLGEHVDLHRRDHRGESAFFAATAGGHNDVLELLGELGLDEDGALENPFRQDWRGDKLAGHKAEQSDHAKNERIEAAMNDAMAQIYAPSKAYADASDEVKTAKRLQMLKLATGSWVGEMDHHVRIEARVKRHQAAAAAKEDNERRKIWNELARCTLRELQARALSCDVGALLLEQAISSKHAKHAVSALVVDEEMDKLNAKGKYANKDNTLYTTQNAVRGNDSTSMTSGSAMTSGYESHTNTAPTGHTPTQSQSPVESEQSAQSGAPSVSIAGTEVSEVHHLKPKSRELHTQGSPQRNSPTLRTAITAVKIGLRQDSTERLAVAAKHRKEKASEAKAQHDSVAGKGNAKAQLARKAPESAKAPSERWGSRVQPVSQAGSSGGGSGSQAGSSSSSTGVGRGREGGRGSQTMLRSTHAGSANQRPGSAPGLLRQQQQRGRTYVDRHEQDIVESRHIHGLHLYSGPGGSEAPGSARDQIRQRQDAEERAFEERRDRHMFKAAHEESTSTLSSFDEHAWPPEGRRKRVVARRVKGKTVFEEVDVEQEESTGYY